MKGRVTILAGCCLIVANSINVTPLQKKEYTDIHRKAIVCDLHCDTVMKLVQGISLGKRAETGHIDIPRLQEGGVDLQAFACWVDPEDVPPEQYGSCIHKMIDKLLDEFRANTSAIALATSGSQAEKIIAAGNIAAVLAIEGGHSIMNSIDSLKAFHDRGVRYMTLTWNNSLPWADAAADTAPQVGGLSAYGRDIVRTMNDIGMIIDISHAAESTFWDVIETTTDPIIASHSCVHALCPHFRNVNDKQIKRIARNGGMIAINCYSGFLDSTFEQSYENITSRYRTEIDSLQRIYKDDRDRYIQERNDLLGNELHQIRPSIDRVIDHIDYIVQLVGPEHVGLGSDFDGTSHVPTGLDDCSWMPHITRKLLERGYDENDIQLILGGNFIRIFKRVCG